ncbi:MAG: NAD(P)/FAD-dependent oxidoreductase [Pontibacterium sp.]
MQQYDVVIVGAGASGLMCAATAGYRGRSVLVLEHSKKIGRKILMSGGGRCNFTNLHNSPANFLSDNPHFCKSALSRYSSQDFIELVERHGVEYHEKTLGQLFCNESSKEILDLLLTECDWAGVTLQTETEVKNVKPVEGRYQLQTSKGPVGCQSLVISTGGLSIPNGGATAFAFDIAEQFGMALKPRTAALVPFTLQPQELNYIKPLSGIAHDVEISAGKTTFKESMLFTHRGISGPAVLQISSYWTPGEAVEINLFPDLDMETWLKQQREQRPKAEIKTVLSGIMTKRLVLALCELWKIEGVLGQCTNDEIQRIARSFHHWSLKPGGTEGYRTAEVTLGGIDTNEVSSKTFEAKKAEGLYFIGECLDVTGHLGGHNFQWAWASGFCAGTFV